MLKAITDTLDRTMRQSDNITTKDKTYPPQCTLRARNKYENYIYRATVPTSGLCYYQILFRSYSSE